MGLPNIIAIVIIALVLGGAIWYIIRSKKKGNKCIGCPYANSCSSNKKSCSCSSENLNENKD